MNLFVKLLYTILIGFVLVVTFFVLFFVLDLRIFFVSLTLLVGIFVLLFAWLLPKNKVKKGVFIGGLSLLLAGVIAVGSAVGYNLYLDAITVVDNSNIDTRKYLAFDPNSKIARLDKEASLRFSILDKLPVVDGAAAFFPMYSAFVEAVYPSNIPPLGREDSPYQYSNTISGYYGLTNGRRDILFAAAPDKGQSSYAEYHGVELELTPIGLEGFVFFTNAKNPVDSLTVDELRAIYAGQITNWAEVGGEDHAILPYQRNWSSGSQTALVKFMGDIPLMEPPAELVSDLMYGIIASVADYQNHRGAIGFSFRQYANEIVANKNIKLLSVNGVSPDKEHIADGSYPITDKFYMVTRKWRHTAEMDKFMEWVLSEEGQYLVETSGYVPINQS